MSAKVFRVLVEAIEDRGREVAIANGSARDRELADYRFWAGVVEGMRMATAIVEQAKADFEDDV